MDRAEFDQLVRNALSNLYDYAALETHALASVLPIPPDQRESRAEHLRRILVHAIDNLQPPNRECSTSSVEWRPYLILHDRYVEGLNLQELQARLSLSERQLRREHGRALRAVASLLWYQVFSKDVDSEEAEGGSIDAGDDFRDFEIALEPLDIAKVVHGVAKTLQRRVQSEGAELRLVLSEKLSPVLTDRVILRQVLLSLFSYVLDVRSDGNVTVGTEEQADQVTLWIQFQAGAPLSDEEEASLETARYWTRRLESTLQKIQLSGREAGSTRMTLSLPRADQVAVMVVDDQEAAMHMFQRYLSRFNIQVIGVQEPDQVLSLARQLQPQAITLDVMMPTIDGWEVLQMLQTDPETQHIPVIVCSVWDEPELASSLGAAGFLKKPITQKDLLGALARLKLLDMPVGSCRGGTSE